MAQQGLIIQDFLYRKDFKFSSGFNGDPEMKQEWSFLLVPFRPLAVVLFGLTEGFSGTTSL